MNRTEFIHAYAARSGVDAPYASLGFIDLTGVGYTRVALPCGCGEETCKGWVMVSAHNVDNHLRTNAPKRLRRAYLEAIGEK